MILVYALAAKAISCLAPDSTSGQSPVQVCGRLAEQVEERRMWIEVEHPSEEIRKENRKFAVKIALATVLAAGIAIGFFVPFHG